VITAHLIKEELYQTKKSVNIKGSEFERIDPVDVFVCEALRKANTQSEAIIELSVAMFDNLRQRLT
jgi:hypothetical protein